MAGFLLTLRDGLAFGLCLLSLWALLYMVAPEPRTQWRPEPARMVWCE